LGLDRVAYKQNIDKNIDLNPTKSPKEILQSISNAINNIKPSYYLIGYINDCKVEVDTETNSDHCYYSYSIVLDSSSSNNNNNNTSSSNNNTNNTIY
jgi:hypothetical protein